MNPQVQIKLLNENAKLPTKANESDAYYDVVATSINHTERYIEYGLGFSSEFSEDMICHIFPRSSISNYDLIMANAPGTIDSSYRGEWKVILYNTSNDTFSFSIGQRIAQAIPERTTTEHFEFVDSLEESVRNEQGFGSSGT